jgi:hypothetical protein
MKLFTVLIGLLWFACVGLSGCGDGNGSDADSAADDDDDNDNNNDDNDDDNNNTSPDDDDDDNDDNNDNDDNDDDNDNDATPYWGDGEDLGPVSLDEYRPLGDQGLNAWEWPTGLAAVEGLLSSSSVKWVATLDAESGDYYLWHVDGELVFSRTIGDDGLEFDINSQVGPDPFPNQDPLFAAGYDAEIALLENPDHIQMPEHGYDVDDPRVGWIPDEQASYPFALRRITQIFDTAHGPDLAFGLHPSQEGGVGTHGNLNVMQSRATLLFSGAGVRPATVIDDAASLNDVAPTVLALLGAEPTEGVDARGHRVTNNFLTWQDGRVLTEVLTDPSVQGLADYAVIIAFDGLAHNELFYHYEHQGSGGWYLPNFFELIERGTYYHGGALVGWPSISLPGHTTIGAGVYQGRHGLIGNDNFRPDTGEMFSFDWFVEHIEELLADPSFGLDYYLRFFHADRGIETIYQAAHRSFGDWELPKPWTWDEAYTACVNEMSFYDADYGYYPLLELVSWLWPDLADWDEQVYLLADLLVPLEFQLVLADPTHDVPKVAMASFYITDHAGETDGPHSESVRNELANIDRYVGLILNAYRDAGVYDRTVFVLVSDHGMELVKPGAHVPWQPFLDAAGIKYVNLGGPLYLKVLRLAADPPTVPPGAPVTLTITATNDDDGAPVSGVALNLTGGDCQPCEAVTGDDGAAQFTVTPSAGEDLQVEAAGEAFSPAALVVEVAE